MTEPHETAPLISITGLTVRLPEGMDRPFAVEKIDYELHGGEILCIVGESGSGKSVTANAIMGLLPPTLAIAAGGIAYRGRELTGLSEDQLRILRGRSMAMIFQDPLSALNPLMTVGDQIAEVMEVHGVGDAARRRARVMELLQFVGLPTPDLLVSVYPHRLSGGQRQRVMIAMALALEPDILIADEPTTALDVTTQAQILELIKRIQRERGMGVIFITHDFGVVADIADRVIVMEKGHIVEQGKAGDVLNAPQHPYTRRLIAAVPHLEAHQAAKAAEAEPVLKVESICKTYRTGGGLFTRARVVEAVKNVSFAVRAGETLGIVGESGSGKSSIGRCLLKLTELDSGRILFRGSDIAPLSPKAFRPLRRHIQMVFQDPYASLNPRQSVAKILTDGPVAAGMTRPAAEEKAQRLLGLVGLDPSAMQRLPHEFSGGQRQRLGIARALMLEPEVLVADESVSALDVSVQAQVLDLLADLQKQLGIAIVFITHDLRVAGQICDAIAVMHRGEIVEHGPPAQIFQAPQHDYTRRLIAAIPGRHWMPDATREREPAG